MRFSTQRLLLMQTCVLGCAGTHKAATHQRSPDEQANARAGAALHHRRLLRHAGLGMDDPLFVAVFTAGTVWALFMGVYLSLPPD